MVAELFAPLDPNHGSPDFSFGNLMNTVDAQLKGLTAGIGDLSQRADRSENELKGFGLKVEENDGKLRGMLNEYDAALKGSLQQLKTDVDATNTAVQTEIKSVDQSHQAVKVTLDQVEQQLTAAGPMLMALGGFTLDDLGYLKTFAVNVQQDP